MALSENPAAAVISIPKVAMARWLQKTVQGTLNAELCARGHSSYEVSTRGRFHDRQP
jgi:hypothetical protein